MFSDIFIHYVLSKNLLTKNQAREVLHKKKAKVRPAVIAVYEKLMTEEQAKKIMSLQKSEDMPFEYLVTKEKILSEEQVLSFLGREPKEDLQIMQILLDKGFMSMQEVLNNLEEFKSCYGLTNEMYSRLVDNHVGSYVSYVACVPDGLFALFADVFITTFMGCITPSLRIEKAYTTDQIDGKYIATVNCFGEKDVTIGFVSNDENAVLNYAGRFYKQKRREFDEDSKDSIKELLNLVGGMFIAKTEEHLGLDMDISVPELAIDSYISGSGKLSAIDVFSIDGKFTIFMV